MLLGLFVNMSVSVGSDQSVLQRSTMRILYAPRIFGYPSRRATILTCSGPLKSPALAILTFLSPSNDVNEPSIYNRTSQTILLGPGGQY